MRLMTYRTTKPIKALATGTDKRPGEVIHKGELPASLWMRLVSAGAIVNTDEVEQLRQRAKAAGIDHWWLKGADTLREELDESNSEG